MNFNCLQDWKIKICSQQILLGGTRWSSKPILVAAPVLLVASCNRKLGPGPKAKGYHWATKGAKVLVLHTDDVILAFLLEVEKGQRQHVRISRKNGSAEEVADIPELPPATTRARLSDQ